MKRKHLFASAVMAAVLAGCSQEEIIVNDNLQSLGERPMVEAPVFSFEGAESRMTTSGNYADVKWQEGDGFGAAVMDSYVAEGKTWTTMFPIQKYLSSNVLFKTEDGKNFFADASMPMGNHLFYAPFNVNNISRGPLAVQLPLEQVVVPNADGSHSNTAITAFYEDKSSPVFVAYDSISATPKTTLNELQMRHIYSLPMITLELGKVHLLGADGDLKYADEKKTVPAYETELTIDSIVFNAAVTASENVIVTSGNIDNDKIVAKLEKAVDPVTGKEIPSVVKWDATQYESNATSDLLIDVEAAKQVCEQIVVKFEGGQKIAAGKPGKFVMVLPGAAYEKQDLKVLVYAKINGKSYVSATSSKNLESRAYVMPARDARLLPGNAYSADEYNANGDPKSSKGSSMTYTIGGNLNDKDSEAIGFIPVDKAVISGYTAISSENDLINFVKNVAYRGEELIQLTKEDAENLLTDVDQKNDPDPKKHFVVTATDESPVVLTDEFVKEFKNACVVAGKSAFVHFLGWNGTNYEENNVVLGDITWNTNANSYIKFDNQIWAQGIVTFAAAPGQTVRLMSTANVTLDSSLNGTITVANEYNGTINLNSAKGHDIWNDYGTLNVNVSTAASLHNGVNDVKEEFEEIEEYVATMTIADGVTATGSIVNRKTGVAEIGEVYATITNDGEMKTTAAAADLIVAGNGEIDNTAKARIDNAGNNTIFAYIGGNFDLVNKYDLKTGLNKLVVNSNIISYTKNFNSLSIKTIDFIDGAGIDLANYIHNDVKNLDLSSVDVINIKAKTTWSGRDMTLSVVSVKSGAIVEDDDCTLTIKNLTVSGYNEQVAYDSKKSSVENGNVASTTIKNAAKDAVITLPEGTYILNATIGDNQKIDKTISLIGDEKAPAIVKGSNKGRLEFDVKNEGTTTLKNLIIGTDKDNLTELWIKANKVKNQKVVLENVKCSSLIFDNGYIDGATIEVEMKNCLVNGVDMKAYKGTLNTYNKLSYDVTSNVVSIVARGDVEGAVSNNTINGEKVTAEGEQIK